jgi:hypothetical protein
MRFHDFTDMFAWITEHGEEQARKVAAAHGATEEELDAMLAWQREMMAQAERTITAEMQRSIDDPDAPTVELQ